MHGSGGLLLEVDVETSLVRLSLIKVAQVAACTGGPCACPSPAIGVETGLVLEHATTVEREIMVVHGKISYSPHEVRSARARRRLPDGYALKVTGNKLICEIPFACTEIIMVYSHMPVSGQLLAAEGQLKIYLKLPGWYGTHCQAP